MGGQEKAAELLADLESAEASRDRWQAEMDRIRAELLDVLTDAGMTKVAGPDGHGYRLKAASRRFNAELAGRVLPSEVLAQISVTKPDAKTAKRVLAGAIYEMCTEPDNAGNPTLSKF